MTSPREGALTVLCIQFSGERIISVVREMREEIDVAEKSVVYTLSNQLSKL